MLKNFMIFLDSKVAGPTKKKQENKLLSFIIPVDDLCSQMEVQTTSKSFGKKRRERYSCSFCGKLYLTKQGLELHRPSHMGIKPFICSYCNKGFSQNGVLKVRGEYCWLFRALYRNTLTFFSCFSIRTSEQDIYLFKL